MQLLKNRSFQRLLSVGCILSSAVADELQPLSDEFIESSSLTNWLDLGVTEGWTNDTHPTLSVENIEIIEDPGFLRITPGVRTWFNNLHGALFYKDLSGDFIVTTRVRVFSRNADGSANPAPPNRSFSLSGIFVHGPRPEMIMAAPDALGMHDWVANTENYVFLAYGSAGNPGTREFEIKTTTNSDSELYFRSHGIDQTQNEALIQMVRVGDMIVCLRNHFQADGSLGGWIIENRYFNGDGPGPLPDNDDPFPNFNDDLQVGLTAYTDWPTAAAASSSGSDATASWIFSYSTPPANSDPDLISEVDYYRFQRPPAGVTQATLAALPVTRGGETLQLLENTALASLLGDAANVPTARLVATGLTVNEADGFTSLSVSRIGSASGQVSCQYFQETGTTSLSDFTPAAGTLTWEDGDDSPKTIPLALNWTQDIEGPETININFVNLTGPANFAGGAVSPTVVVTVEDHPLDQWRQASFGERANDPAAALNADFDNDGLPNLLERVLLGDPTQVDAPSVLPTAAVDNDRLTLTFTPAASLPATTLTVQSSTTLVGTWTDIATRPAGSSTWNIITPGTIVSNNGPEISVSAPSVISDGSPLFLRLRATVPTP